MKSILWKIFCSFIFLQYFLNFLGSSLVIHNYAVIAAIMFLLIIFLPLNQSIWGLMIFILIEGQGRVVWGYQPVFRILFDLLTGIWVFKSIFIKKQILNTRFFPKLLIAAIVLHFIWWVIELFNPLGAGFFASFATSKFYIFPFFYFFALTLNPFDFEQKQTQKNLLFFMGLCCLSTVLCQFQLNEGADFMHGISSNYTDLFEKFKEFGGERFRPWGTAVAPGAMSSFSYITIGFFFLIREKVISSDPFKQKLITFIKFLFLFGTIYSALISNVRAALFKSIIVLLLSFGIVFWQNKYKLKIIVSCIVSLFFLILFNPDPNSLIESANLDRVVERYENLGEKGVLGQRSGIGKVILTLADRVDNILGFGVGMTTSYLPAFKEQRKSRIDRKDHEFWALDNLYVFLILELGLGSIFYLFILATINFHLIGKTFFLYQEGSLMTLKMVVASMSTILAITLGNWGAVGWLFNPESFFIWIWVYIGFYEYKKFEKKKKSAR